MATSCQLIHLNNDSSWLLIIGFDGGSFKLLIDPWSALHDSIEISADLQPRLHGQQVDFFPAFSAQRHGKNPPHWSSIAAVEAEFGPLDAVCVSHDFTYAQTLSRYFQGSGRHSDHCHRETLVELSPELLIFACTPEAVSRLRGFSHFKRIIAVPRWSSDGAVTGCLAATLAAKQGVDLLDGLTPDLQLSFSYLPTTKRLDFARLHGALLLSFRSVHSTEACGIVYSPHGLPTSSLENFAARRKDGIELLALMHSYDKVVNPPWLGGIVAHGVDSAIPAALLLEPRLLISTHDENDKEARGLISRTLARTPAPSLAQLQERLSTTRTKVVAVANGERIDLL